MLFGVVVALLQQRVQLFLPVRDAFALVSGVFAYATFGSGSARQIIVAIRIIVLIRISSRTLFVILTLNRFKMATVTFVPV